MEIRKVGVVGCGLMGSGIAQVSAMSGHPTMVREVSQDLLDSGLARIERFLGRGVEKEKVSPEEMERTMDNITGTLKLEELAERDIVVEAIVEDLDAKIEAFQTLDNICDPATIFASNTSSLTVTAMARAIERPERLLGLHFFNPVPLMKLVEVVRTILTDGEVFNDTISFVESLGKEAVTARDNSGFIVNLLLVPYLLDSIRALENGVATVEDIDKGMRLGCAYPMGPLTLLDFVGLDTTCRIADIMFEEYKEKRYAPPPLLRKMVLAGYFGKKSGKGFYDYSGEEPVPTDIL